MWKQQRRRNVKSLFTLSFDATVRNVKIFGYDDNLQYLTPRIKGELLKSLSHFMWRQTTSKNILASLVHSKLEMIDLSNAPLDDDILRILGICKRLQRLYLIRDESYSISREGLVRFLQNQTELHTLQIRNCDIVDNSVLKSISEFCQKITALDIKGCTKFTDDGLLFLRTLKCLKSITLSKTMITNDGLIEFIKEPTGPLLKELLLDNCKHLSILGLQEVPECCPNLEIFVFFNCEFSGDMATLLTDQSSLKNLKQLTWDVTW